MLCAVALNPPTQYADDSNLRARQRLWEHQDPPFDIVGWVLDLAGVSEGHRVLDVGCGNGAYLRALRDRRAAAVGCDFSRGMARAAAAHGPVVNGDVQALPFAAARFDVVLAPHMLYHVADRAMAAREMRRVLRPDGVCVAVTNGSRHMRALRALVEEAVTEHDPEWQMRNPSTHVFSLENGAAQLAPAFESVTCVRAEGVAPVEVRDATVAADYVASVADHYQHEVSQPWSGIVAAVRARVEADIERDGSFVVTGETGAFVCR